ncbi:ABC transporter substrate-binding protein [Paenibacillus sp. 1001270B_150601_E10]|uniref:ABC transporter substrate-binding protein n=1 Tax=Paenibacillus sp. 1001270B_150601_E10 TaxID=2787079 RepID=UPI001E43011D|nr:ABC transporter substrate-binding protein [Paenibacillus sp. 1001270B_150601_E10]
MLGMNRFTPFRKSSFLLTSVIVLALLLSACGTAKEEANPASNQTAQSGQTASNGQAEAKEKVMKDAMGHEVTIPAKPSHLIASYLEDHLVALGVKPAAQWSVPNGIQDYLADGLEGVPTIPYNLPVEDVLSHEPDLLIIGDESSVQNGLYDQYAKIAPTYVLGTETTKDWRAALKKIGDILNLSDKADQVLKDYEQKEADTKEKLKPLGERSAAILWLTNKQFFLVDETVSSGAVLYGDLGIKPPNLVSEIPAGSRASWNPITLEKLAELDADDIFIVNSDKATGADEVTNTALWQSIPAVKAGNVHEMDPKGSWLYSGAVAGSKIMDDVVKALTP